MRRASAMYEWSGGTDYRHTCFECKNCLRQQVRKQTQYKCRVYQVLFSSEKPWKPSFIACRFFDKTYSGPPLKKKNKNEQIEDHLSLFN